MVHIGDRVNTVLKINAKIEKIGTSYFTISVNASSTQGNIVEYIYVIDGVEKAPTDKTIYTEENLEEKSEHTAKVIVVDEKGNRKTSREFKIITETRTYIIKDGKSTRMVDWELYPVGYYSNIVAPVQYEDYIAFRTPATYLTISGYTSSTKIDFTAYSKLYVESSQWGNGLGGGFYVFIGLDKLSYVNNSNQQVCVGTLAMNQDINGIFSLDVTNLNDEYYISPMALTASKTAREMHLYNLWLEK